MTPKLLEAGYPTSLLLWHYVYLISGSVQMQLNFNKQTLVLGCQAPHTCWHEFNNTIGLKKISIQGWKHVTTAVSNLHNVQSNSQLGQLCYLEYRIFSNASFLKIRQAW